VKVLGITHCLEGVTRPTHFAGVTLVVAKLFLAVKPHIALFGRKDAQQALIIRRMTTDLNFGITIDIAPTVREPDGVAMSSRNGYLSPEERKRAVILSRALRTGFDLWNDGERNAARLVQSMRAVLEEEPQARLDYLAAVAQETLEPVETVVSGTLVAGAVQVGTTRLIDNWWVTTDGKGEF
jgi:pantoate--beta-alanine ligase